MVIQDNSSGRWLEDGVIEQARRADDQSIQSYEIRMEKGTIKIRNKRFIKHKTKEDRQVQFDTQAELDNNRGQTDQEESQLEAADNREPESSKRARSGPHTRSMAKTAV